MKGVAAILSIFLALVATFDVAAGADCIRDAAIELARPSSGAVVAPFGVILHPVLRQPRMHAGVDFADGLGSPVAAAAPGTVDVAAYDGEFGNRIVISHGSGLQTSYGHLARLGVRQGDCVSRGQQIGTVGATGLAAGPALHFEVLRGGQPVDPMPLLPAQ